MALYAWTIKVPSRQPIARVTDIEELHGVLRVLNLPGLRNPADITADADGIVADSGKFRHIALADGSEWSVMWVVDASSNQLQQ